MTGRGNCSSAFCIIAAMLCTAGIARRQVVITEVMHSPGGTDALWEWLEVRNITEAPLNLDGWVFDDDDDTSIGFANISTNGGAQSTVVPAGGVAVLYAGDALEYMPERFQAAWGGGITLIGVQNFTSLNPGDAIGLWPSHASYLADAIPMSTTSPRRTFANAAIAMDYSTGFPAAADGRSIAWNGSGSVHSGQNWVQSQGGVLNAITSVETTIADAQINSSDDWGNPGVLPNVSVDSGLVISEIMYAPKSPLATVEYDETDFEWVEVVNNSAAAINFVQKPHVFDDDDGSKLGTANVRSGSLAIGEVGVLFNEEQFTAADMQAMWGTGIKFLPVENWPLLNNTGAGDVIAIWPSYSAYNTEPVSGAGRTHQNALAAVAYDTRDSEDWPAVNNQSSIWRHNLTGDPDDGTNWTRAGAGSDELSYHPAAIYELAIDHEGGDVGSPGFAPAFVPGLTGDYNGDGSVDAADYVIWRKQGGTPEAYAAWRANYGATLAGGRDSAQGGAVPEPHGGLLWFTAAIGLLTTSAINRRRPLPALR